MTAEPDEQQLPGLGDLSPAESKAKPARRKSAEVCRTDSGDTAGDILGAWLGWYERGTGVPVPDSVKNRLGRQVKSLVATGYQTDDIKHGLAVWTVEQMDNDMLSPQMLDRFTWRYARDKSAKATAWRDQMRQRVAAFGGTQPARGSRREQRRNRNLQVLQDWGDD